MTWKLTVLLGNPPELQPVDPDTGNPMPDAEWTKDERVVVDTIEFDEKPDGNPWVAPDNPSWGEPILDPTTGEEIGRKKGGTYSFVMEEVK